jgi:hypothetical protein
MRLEQVPCVEFYPGVEKRFPILLLERGLAVMLFLSLDVFDQVIDVTPGQPRSGLSLGGWFSVG